jgi:hypothetical protein
MSKKTTKKRKKNKIKVVYKKLGRSKVWGQCYQGENKIEIEERLRGKRRFFVTVHELLHDQFPETSETKIRKAETVIGNVLWGENYRRVEQ